MARRTGGAGVEPTEPWATPPHLESCVAKSFQSRIDAGLAHRPGADAPQRLHQSTRECDSRSATGHSRTEPWFPSTGLARRLSYLSSFVSLRSAVPSAFTMYTSLLRRKAIVRPSGDHANQRRFSALRVSRRSPLPSAFTTKRSERPADPNPSWPSYLLK